MVWAGQATEPIGVLAALQTGISVALADALAARLAISAGGRLEPLKHLLGVNQTGLLLDETAA